MKKKTKPIYIETPIEVDWYGPPRGLGIAFVVAHVFLMIGIIVFAAVVLYSLVKK
jgi:hypothetical protein